MNVCKVWEKMASFSAHNILQKKLKVCLGSHISYSIGLAHRKYNYLVRYSFPFQGLSSANFEGGGGDSKLLDNLLKWQIACGCRLVVPLATKVSARDLEFFDDLQPSIVIGRLWLQIVNLLKFEALAGNCPNILWVTSDS